MNDQNNKPIYNISIYQLDNQFYITPMVRKPPGARTSVLPLYAIPVNNIDRLVESIGAAKLKSDVRYNQDTLSREDWDGDNEKVWNEAQKHWDIFWNEDGTVDIGFAKPYVKHRNGMEWILVPEAKKILQPPVSLLDIAEEIVNQAKA